MRKQADMETEWLTANEAAQYLKVKPRTLLQWVRERKIPAHRLSGVQAVCMAVSESMNWMLSCVRHPLTLLMGGSNEGPATYKRVRALRQTAQDLELPLV
jgi:excisionase family DNA binding protein